MNADLGNNRQSHQDPDVESQIRGDFPRAVERGQDVAADSDRQCDQHEEELKNAPGTDRINGNGCH